MSSLNLNANHAHAALWFGCCTKHTELWRHSHSRCLAASLVSGSRLRTSWCKREPHGVIVYAAYNPSVLLCTFSLPTRFISLHFRLSFVNAFLGIAATTFIITLGTLPAIHTRGATPLLTTWTFAPAQVPGELFLRLGFTVKRQHLCRCVLVACVAESAVPTPPSGTI